MFNILRLLRPSSDFIPPHTPDFTELQDAPGWLFFEYGEFKHGLPHQNKFKSNEVRGKALTVQKLPMWVRNNGLNSYPIALDYHPEAATQRASVSGEVYLVPTKAIPFIDSWRSNGVTFDRKSVKLIIPSGEEIKAFMYKGRKEFWSECIDWDIQFYRGRQGAQFSFVHPQRCELNSNKYYSVFTNTDLKESIGFTNGHSPRRQQQAA